MTARRKTRFVVRRGRIGRPLSLSWNLNGRGAKMESVPVPVLMSVSPVAVLRGLIENLPIWSPLAMIENFANKVEILVFFVKSSHFV